MTTYLVRMVTQSQQDFDALFDNNVVAVGWSDVDFSRYEDKEQLVHDVKDRYYNNKETAPQVVGKKLNEVRRFKQMKSGDHVIVPYGNSIRLAIASGNQQHDSSVHDRDFANQHNVEYLKDGKDYISVPREELSEGLQRRLRVRGTTIADLAEFEAEIDQLYKNPKQGWLSRGAEEDAKRADKWRQQLLMNIQDGRTNLAAGGSGLEQLVLALLKLEGYDGSILSKRRFPGIADADIEVSKSDRLNETKLLVQVKHHRGESDPWGGKQLDEIRKTELWKELEDHTLILVTSAAASKDLEKYCEDNDIKLVVGTVLVEWIYDYVDRLPHDWRIKLGISGTREFLKL